MINKTIIIGILLFPLAAPSVYGETFQLTSVSVSGLRDAADGAAAPLPAAVPAGDTYVFPVRPGMPQWKALSSYTEMLNACQIPGAILDGMSTPGLVETVLNYPLFWVTVLAQDDIQRGFNVMSKRFNGAAELLRRKDAGAVLLEKYKNMDPAAPAGAGVALPGQYRFYFYRVELLLAQNAVRSGMTEEQRSQLQSELLSKKEAKKLIGGYGGWLANEVMALNGISPEAAARVYSTVVYTPRLSQVTALQMEPADELGDIRQCDIEFIIGFPDATWEASCTRMYNCHSYAWHDQSLSNTIWINAPNQKEYLRDESYVQWLGPVSGGMKLDYSADDHSAIFVSGANPYVSPDKSFCRAKWGHGPRMLSTCGYAPYDSTSILVYAPPKTEAQP